LLNQRQWFSIIYFELLLETASFGGMKQTKKTVECLFKFVKQFI